MRYQFIEGYSVNKAQATNGFNQELLDAAVRFNSIVLGIVSGCLAAIVIFVATLVSVSKWGENAGNYLNLLAVFFPGYSATHQGAWIGAFWGFVFSGLAGFLTYWFYGKLIGKQLASGAVMDATDTDPIFKPAILRLQGKALGIAIGAAMGAALMFSTFWLVIRGTADQSIHAKLLANYLPGYSPSIMGGVIGAIDLFVLVFIGCSILAAVYNKIVEIRHGKTV